jgi:hypothetical protein
VAHVVPAAVHTLDGQQGWLAPPQAAQVLPLQTVLPAVQRLFEQHESPSPPQRVPAPSGDAPPSTTPATHAPAEQVRFAALPELAQAVPAGTQVAPLAVLVQQQPPPLHRPAEQQASPAPPQLWQVPALVPDSAHSAPVAVQVSFAQQGSPSPPHG